MSSDITPDLIKSLISSVDSTNVTVKELAVSVSELVQVEKVREERDKHQEEKNKKYDDHIRKYEASLLRLVSWHITIDKVKVPLIVAFVLALLTLLGFNWKG